MKISTEDLERVSTGNQEEPQARKVVPEKPFGKDEVNFDAGKDISIYPMKELLVFSEMGWKLVASLREAINRRNSYEAVLSFREADIAARSRGAIDLSEGSVFRYALIEGESCLVEGIPGHADSGFELRRRYNNGVKWIRERRKSGLPEVLQKATERLMEIKTALKMLNLDLWEREIEDGFHPDFLRPEWMTHAQYNKCRSRPVKVVNP